MKQAQLDKLKGVYSALFTPYTEQGRIGEAMLERLVEYHLASGLTGFYVTGTTGESLLLSEKERMLIRAPTGNTNFEIYEERGTGDIILTLPEQPRTDWADFTADCYRYCIAVQ